MLLRAAITACGLLGFSAVASAEAAEGTSAPTIAAQIRADEWTNCRYKPLAGSHIKVQVCTGRDRLDYRMDRQARTIAVHFFPALVGPPAVAVPVPLPQVQ
jgi:hypothetical protein